VDDALANMVRVTRVQKLETTLGTANSPNRGQSRRRTPNSDEDCDDAALSWHLRVKAA